MDIPVELFIRTERIGPVDALRQYVRRRLSFALRPFEHQIRHVRVRLIDVNGPRKGVDSRCSITADLTEGRRLFVDAMSAWPFAAVTQAARRLNEAARRELARRSARRAASATALRQRFEGRTREIRNEHAARR